MDARLEYPDPGSPITFIVDEELTVFLSDEVPLPPDTIRQYYVPSTIADCELAAVRAHRVQGTKRNTTLEENLNGRKGAIFGNFIGQRGEIGVSVRYGWALGRIRRYGGDRGKDFVYKRHRIDVKSKNHLSSTWRPRTDLLVKKSELQHNTHIYISTYVTERYVVLAGWTTKKQFHEWCDPCNYCRSESWKLEEESLFPMGALIPYMDSHSPGEPYEPDEKEHENTDDTGSNYSIVGAE